MQSTNVWDSHVHQKPSLTIQKESQHLRCFVLCDGCVRVGVLNSPRINGIDQNG